MWLGVFLQLMCPSFLATQRNSASSRLNKFAGRSLDDMRKGFQGVVLPYIVTNNDLIM